MNKYELYFQVARAHAQEQQVRHQQFLMRAGIILGFSATLAGLAGLAISNVGNWNLAWAIPFAMIMSFFLLVAVACSIVLWTFPAYRSPSLKEFSKNLPNFNDDRLYEWVGDAYSDVVNEGEKTLDGKAKLLRVALIGLVCEVGLLAVLTAISTRF